jgi:hypothetical protein
MDEALMEALKDRMYWLLDSLDDVREAGGLTDAEYELVHAKAVLAFTNLARAMTGLVAATTLPPQPPQ